MRGSRVLQGCTRHCLRRSAARSCARVLGRVAPSTVDAELSTAQAEPLWRHTLGTIALDVPLLLTFCLLLNARTGLPQREPDLERLNRARCRRGKPPLLAHIEARSPLLPELRVARSAAAGTRQSPRLHQVRGHLVRRGNQLFWRVPHLRGSARAGTVASRTVIWTFERPVSHR